MLTLEFLSYSSSQIRYPVCNTRKDFFLESLLMLMIPFIQLYSCYLPFLHKHLAIYLLLVKDIMESGVPLEKNSL